MGHKYCSGTPKEWLKGKKIVWSKFAAEHDVPGRNGGQVVKELAFHIGIDVYALDGRQPDMRVRVHKRKPSGGEVSAVPSNPTVKKVKEAWANMITTGMYTLGEPCAPYSLTHYDVQSGKLEKTNVTIFDRKVPLNGISL